MTVIARNKRASFDYALDGHYEAGLVLTGSEVKSVKTGHASLKGSFVTVKGDELYLTTVSDRGNWQAVEKYVENQGKTRKEVHQLPLFT